MEGLLVKDNLWSPEGHIITDTRLIQLLKSKTVERLKWIGQNGPLNHYPSPDGIVSPTSRYDHSVGAMILTLKIGGTNDEAIAALLHDIIHTAFSHAFDFIVQSAAISYHETQKDRLLDQFSDELQDILGPNWKRYLNEKKWPLIKKNNPFAIDIADYTVRDGVAFNLCTREEARERMIDLYIDQETRHLKSKTYETSIWWSMLSEKTNGLIYTTPWNYAMNHYIASALKELVERNLIDIDILEKVPYKNIEIDTWQMALKTEYGQMLQIVHTKKWEFFPLDRKNMSGYVDIGEFDVRMRVVKPPVMFENTISYPTTIEKYILAYRSQ
ncbi:HD phosphohydrolase protein [Fadolivirus algeromassiliense]|jgi:hypothetical protein|uniref:HD phosphohydrolase protein n=1 Tax=Fadolivirus FV1/VV64 TaxID=3070911 RepID=A0A7D3QVE8_9VIRU|nr:HD phosphohydrolase protein [Fadolivirus algeromassiliense]QKF94204.1 HD phosphohydrolase protein [Fadolivirus FV1/VV64]